MVVWVSALKATMPAIATLAMAVLLCLLLWRYFVCVPVVLRCKKPELPRAHLLLWLAALLVLSRLGLYLIGLAGSAWRGESVAYLHDFSHYWVRWDANHYLGLAKNWYVNEGDPRFHIVFYPLYPLLVRILVPLFGGHYVLCACIVSNLCLYGASWALYRLAQCTYGSRVARWSVIYLLLCPASLFLSIPYTESLFLMLTLMSVLAARRHRFALAILLGALSSATRVLGLLTAVPVFYECLCLERTRCEGNPARLWRRSALWALGVVLIASGLAAYLLLNYSVTGNPFQFLIYQREHWGQTFGSLWNTLRYSLENAFYYRSIGSRLGTWIPQVIAIPLAIALLAFTARRLHPGDGAYALLYIYMALAPTWLLSGPRYLMALYPLYPMLALVTRRRWQRWLAVALLTAGTVYFVYFYAIYGSLF